MLRRLRENAVEIDNCGQDFARLKVIRWCGTEFNVASLRWIIGGWASGESRVCRVRPTYLPVSAAATHGAPSADSLLLVVASSGSSPLLRRAVPSAHVAVGRPGEQTGSVVKRTVERENFPKKQIKRKGCVSGINKISSHSCGSPRRATRSRPTPR